MEYVVTLWDHRGRYIRTYIATCLGEANRFAKNAVEVGPAAEAEVRPLVKETEYERRLRYGAYLIRGDCQSHHGR